MQHTPKTLTQLSLTHTYTKRHEYTETLIRKEFQFTIFTSFTTDENWNCTVRTFADCGVLPRIREGSLLSFISLPLSPSPLALSLPLQLPFLFDKLNTAILKLLPVRGSIPIEKGGRARIRSQNYFNRKFAKLKSFIFFFTLFFKRT